MGNKADDPVDHVRTTRKHAGQNMKNTAAMPGLIAVGVAVPAFFIALFGFATGNLTLGVICLVVAAVLAVAGLAWLVRERKRVRRVEEQYLRDHPEADAQTPAS